MSNISLPFEDQIRHFYVASAFTAEANIADFIANSTTVGDMQMFDEDGNALTYTSGKLPPGKDFYVARRNNKGTVSQSDLISAKDITYIRGTAPVQKVGKSQDLTLASPAAGDEYVLIGKVHYANSEENFITFWAGHSAVTGDTAETIMDSLAVQMATNLANSINTSTIVQGTFTPDGTTAVKLNKYFDLDSTVAGTLTITEKDWILEEFRVGLRTQDQLMWNFELTKNDASVGVITKAETAGTYAKGQGYQMIELERFLVGHRAEFELKDHTLSFGRLYDVDPNEVTTAPDTGGYYVLDLKYFDISRDDPKHSDKMLTIISTDAQVVDEFGFAIEVQMGIAAEGDIWTELDPAGDGADNLP